MRPTSRTDQPALNFDAPPSTVAPPSPHVTPPEATSQQPAVTEVREWREPERVSPLDLSFWAYHEANPAVYMALAELARAALRQGKRRIGAKALWERVRWDMWLATEGDEFNLNNNHTSRYARLLMARETDLRGVFVLRELRS